MDHPHTLVMHVWSIIRPLCINGDHWLILTNGQISIWCDFSCPWVPYIYRMKKLDKSVVSRQSCRGYRMLKMTPEQDQYIVTQHLRDRFRTATQTAAETPGIRQPRISASTVRRRLHQVNLSARSPAIVTLLTPLRQQNRLNWARIHQNWTQMQWRGVLFSDESRFGVVHPRPTWKSVATTWREVCRLLHTSAQPMGRWGCDGVGSHLVRSQVTPGGHRREYDCAMLHRSSTQTNASSPTGSASWRHHLPTG